MDEALAIIAAAQAGLLALLAAQTKALMSLTAKIGELCGRVDGMTKKR